jgi:hypothetical protein
MPLPFTRPAHLSRPEPSLLGSAPADPRTRRVAETAWSLYCPAALLLGALVLAGGCRSDNESPYADAGPARLAGQSVVTEAGDAERLERNAEAPGELALADATVPAELVYASYPVELPLVGTAAARATVRYGKASLDVANLSKIPWTDGRIWINRQYSVPLPVVAPGDICTLRFDWIRDEAGTPFPVKASDVFVDKVELVLGDERTRVRHGLDY